MPIVPASIPFSISYSIIRATQYAVLLRKHYLEVVNIRDKRGMRKSECRTIRRSVEQELVSILRGFSWNRHIKGSRIWI